METKYCWSYSGIFYIELVTRSQEGGRERNKTPGSWLRSSSLSDYLGPLLQGRIVFRFKFWMRRGWLESMVILVGAEEMMTPAVSQISL